ncbi:P-loop containing nucleoside triphosphate hydrolase protein [Auriscalpium vulgare]|uniref:P-loop containing nucleoside triphosphate hydrolase protein n=1 Tax=Auriscalpium vulgare TaxID=40419 RepID=A0ACB8RFN7_9AGAM|nr:P-loop containing nucleoside triphosphate hydrolase protein [Auriscalpium vulgare]
MDCDDDYDAIYPTLPFSTAFYEALRAVSETAIATALQIFSAVFDASRCKIRLREDQILPAVHFAEGRDVVCIARTGSGKTMQLVVSALLHPDAITLVFSPLKRLQQSMVNELNSYDGIHAIAVNSDMHNDSDQWRAIREGKHNIILTSPEQSKPIDGHPTRLFRAMQERRFCNRISRVIVDECHLAWLWGLSFTKTRAFRPAWAHIGDIRISLPPTAPLLALTATAPPRIESALPKLLALRDPVTFKSTINRPNQTYAVHPIHGALTNFENLRFLVPTGPDTPDSDSAIDVLKQMKKCLIFMDNKSHLSVAARHLYDRFPPRLRAELKRLGAIKVYHSDMSTDYLDTTYDTFEASTDAKLSSNDAPHMKAFCRILIATSGASTGINIADILIVIQYGLPMSLEELLQRLGRNVRDFMLLGLSLLMAEDWAAKPSKKPTAKELRTSDDVKKYAATTGCRREYLATYAADDAPDALEVAPGAFCCDYHGYIMQDDFHIPLFAGESTNTKRPPAVPKKYRDMWQRVPLIKALRRWLASDSRKSKAPVTYPSYFVLSTRNMDDISKMHPSKVTGEDALADALGKTASWRARWATDLFQVLQDFECSARLNKVQWMADHRAVLEQKKAAKARGVPADDDGESIRRMKLGNTRYILKF